MRAAPPPAHSPPATDDGAATRTRPAAHIHSTHSARCRTRTPATWPARSSQLSWSSRGPLRLAERHRPRAGEENELREERTIRMRLIDLIDGDGHAEAPADSPVRAGA